jgi:hypothetical protein
VAEARPGDDFGQRELLPWLAGAALLVLAMEWWVFHRGSIISQREQELRDKARTRRPRVLFLGRRE